MKLKDFLNWINENNIPDNYELYTSTNNIYDVQADKTYKKIIFKTANGLESYYEHKSKMMVLKDMVECVRLDGVIEISEIEVVKIAHDLELSYEDVANEFRNNNIDVGEL